MPRMLGRFAGPSSCFNDAPYVHIDSTAYYWHKMTAD